MKRRSKVPSATDKYYLQKSTGYSPCRLGNRTYMKALAPKSTLPNCVGYVVGRAGEVSGEKKCALWSTNAENYWDTAKKKGYDRGQTPRAGSIMVWEGIGGAAGHVAFCEIVKSDSTVITSESGWNYKNSYVMAYTRKKGDGNWGLSTAKYKFYGFVYLPYVEPYSTPEKVSYGEKSDGVKWLQWAINRSGVTVTIDGSYGPKTKAALKKAQEKWKKKGVYGGVIDGLCGKNTINSIVTLYTIE